MIYLSQLTTEHVFSKIRSHRVQKKKKKKFKSFFKYFQRLFPGLLALTFLPSSDKTEQMTKSKNQSLKNYS